MFRFKVLTTNLTIKKPPKTMDSYCCCCILLYPSFSNRKDANTLFALFFYHFTACFLFKLKFFLHISVRIFFSWGRLLEIHRFPDQDWKLMQMISTSTLILCDSHIRKTCLIMVNSINYFFHFLPLLSSSQSEIN